MTTPTAVRQRGELSGVAGVPETALTPEMLRQAPDTSPPAPWAVGGRAVIWACRANRHVADALPASIRKGSRPLLVVTSMVHYDQTPVGPYDEVVAAAILLEGRRWVAHVPFIAVDSAASLVGGRLNWALPKTMAQFDGRPASGIAMTARGQNWEVRARASAFGPSLPFRSGTRLVQEDADGRLRRFEARMTGRWRPARVRVHVDGSGSLPNWLPSGTFPGLVATRAEGAFPLAPGG